MNRPQPNQAQARGGWREHFRPHPTALLFHECTTDEQRRELEKDIEKHSLRQPIVTASVPGEDKVFVIDGITRLDAMEALGRKIVNEQGEWIGALAAMNQERAKVIHHYGYTHQQITDLVVSLNLHRRHLTDDQRGAIITELRSPALKAEARERQKTGLRKGDKFPGGVEIDSTGNA
jgi:hypothetical protein